MKDETPYIETEILLALMNEDIERLEKLIKAMLPGELYRFACQVSGLSKVLLDASRGIYPTDND